MAVMIYIPTHLSSETYLVATLHLQQNGLSLRLKFTFTLDKPQSQPNNPLHGVKLADILEYLVKEYGWKELGKIIKIRCFNSDPTIKSSLKFLRKTEWARTEVEEFYLYTLEKKRVD